MSGVSNFLLAELHRAQHQGAKTMEVSTAELSELLAKLESAERPMGKPVGWASADKLEAMRHGARKYVTVALYKSDKFNEQVVSLPREVES